MIRYQPAHETGTAEMQKLKFNKCEWKLLYCLWTVQFIFVAAGVSNIIWSATSDNDNHPFIIEAAIYFFMGTLVVIVSACFIYTVKT